MKNNNYEIIKDPEDENLFYIAIQDDYDEDNERSVIGFGKTENEALKDALKNSLECLYKSLNALDAIALVLSRDVDHRFSLESRFEENKPDYYIALRWDGEKKEWYKCYM